ncbi:glycoside hydrolase family 7 protein [Annulohypoxylon maeteangense]|uniref:glycoside hydrolase family 7 protein n=1 Tax=Annulohypoxylon maeteangense TaxID=1927788 RepID=UPI002007A306|nr:glycoside hydrolase family 7 protein [Annulohypoxylon maeteangense]KAI0885401.1 glycoside hydrolase family 7 protein [Annulohypoxylon maeteangense]
MASKFLYVGLLGSLLTSAAVAQGSEAHPPLTTWKCTTAGGCVQQNTSVVLDKDSKYASGAAGSRTADDYAAMGVSTEGDAVTMYHYVKSGSTLNPASPRIYLLDANGQYVMMELLGQELSVDVDYSQVPCGENGAFYLSEMKADGGGSSGGASAGQGYCDAQCQGYCCNEMDILEANAKANAMTPHPCQGDNCDKAGCGYNPYASGQRNLWATGGTVDTNKKFTVITQFAGSGSLTSISRIYIQDGKQTPGGTISACNDGQGGLAGMGAALGRGMVLAMSIWNDATQQMSWLDAGNNGPCNIAESTPANIQAQHPDTHVTFSNIRWGDIGSTTKG